MPSFSRKSRDRLSTCDERIQKVCKEAIKFFDFSVIYGHRTIEEQDELYAQGRTKPGRIVTWKQGGESVHNTYPSLAVDLAPWPIDWSDTVRFGELAGIIKYVAWQMGVDMTWGGDWPNFKDYPHYQTRPENE